METKKKKANPKSMLTMTDPNKFLRRVERKKRQRKQVGEEEDEVQTTTAPAIQI